ncbi:MAG: hypothetical protein HKP08_02160 [Flavobacteriaceae bacterium]|nr:hypothetical protein [Flavobacteriaceae bacterium]
MKQSTAKSVFLMISILGLMQTSGSLFHSKYKDTKMRNAEHKDLAFFKVLQSGWVNVD